MKLMQFQIACQAKCWNFIKNVIYLDVEQIFHDIPTWLNETQVSEKECAET